jgi:hypothetical protein
MLGGSTGILHLCGGRFHWYLYKRVGGVVEVVVDTSPPVAKALATLPVPTIVGVAVVIAVAGSVELLFCAALLEEDALELGTLTSLL